ncbi:MAG TPA: GNAT family N-acetyltransferase [Candidatus Limnocylindria bacterium]
MAPADGGRVPSPDAATQHLASLDLVLRRPTLADAEGLFRLQADIDRHDFGAIDMSLDDIRTELGEVALDTDAWLVLPEGGGSDPVAYGMVQPPVGTRLRAHVAVHPSRRGSGLGRALAGIVEDRARERAAGLAVGDGPVTLQGWINGESEADAGWARSLGYAWARRFLRMRIDMTEPPPAPSWPEGIAVRTFRLGQDERAMYEAQEEAFADHWGHVTMPFEEWTKRLTRHDFEAELWLMALDGERVVATSTNSVIPENLGWISGLGVVPSHRRRGLARAILLQAFNDFWRRGQRSVALGVDADSLTGATRLYESAGMRVVESHDQVSKQLR